MERKCDKGGVEAGPDLTGASRETLLAVITEHQMVITELRREIAQLKAQLAGRGGPRGCPATSRAQAANLWGRRNRGGPGREASPVGGRIPPGKWYTPLTSAPSAGLE